MPLSVLIRFFERQILANWMEPLIHPVPWRLGFLREGGDRQYVANHGCQNDNENAANAGHGLALADEEF